MIGQEIMINGLLAQSYVDTAGVINEVMQSDDVNLFAKIDKIYLDRIEISDLVDFAVSNNALNIFKYILDNNAIYSYKRIMSNIIINADDDIFSEFLACLANNYGFDFNGIIEYIVFEFPPKQKTCKRIIKILDKVLELQGRCCPGLPVTSYTKSYILLYLIINNEFDVIEQYKNYLPILDEYVLIVYLGRYRHCDTLTNSFNILNFIIYEDKFFKKSECIVSNFIFKKMKEKNEK